MTKRIQKISRYRTSIFQGRFDFQSAARGASLTAAHPFERHAFQALFAALALAACLYVYFVGATVLNVIARKEAMQSSAALASIVSTLEQEFYLASATIDPSAGERLGLSPVSNTSYVYRPGNAALADGAAGEL